MSDPCEYLTHWVCHCVKQLITFVGLFRGPHISKLREQESFKGDVMP